MLLNEWISIYLKLRLVCKMMKDIELWFTILWFCEQVQVLIRKVCEPLEEDSFRPILHHYDGPKFRLELNVPEVNFTSSISFNF